MALDRVGNVVSRSDEGLKRALAHPAGRKASGTADVAPPRARLELLLDQALQESFSAGDPVAVGVGADRRVA